MGGLTASLPSCPQVRAHGYKSADKDVIRVGLQEDVQLQNQQGLISCQPLHEVPTVTPPPLPLIAFHP